MNQKLLHSIAEEHAIPQPIRTLTSKLVCVVEFVTFDSINISEYWEVLTIACRARKSVPAI